MAQFGTVFSDHISIARFENGSWGEADIEPLAPLPMHPASHVFHYASTCFEGFKAYRWKDGKARIFRLHDHVARMQRSAASLRLPVPDAEQLANMVIDLVRMQLDDIPEPPSSLYLRPTLIGTLENIGAAAAPSTRRLCSFWLRRLAITSRAAATPLKLLVEENRARSTEQLGSTKTGGNYAAALGPTLDAREEYGVDQVLFCPGGDVQETGAANFFCSATTKSYTKSLDTSFLHGMTRASFLTLANELGYRVNERHFTVKELLDWSGTYEAALSGTAATLTPVGALVYKGEETRFGTAQRDPNVERLRAALQAIQYGEAEDTHGWLTEVS